MRLVQELHHPDYSATVERAFVITIAGYDWNCPQHITPRFTEAEVTAAVAPLHARIRTLEAELAGLNQKANGCRDAADGEGSGCPRFCDFGDDFVGDVARHLVVVRELHRVRGTTTGHAA